MEWPRAAWQPTCRRMRGYTTQWPAPLEAAAPPTKHQRGNTETQWDNSQPIYRQLRDRVVAMILEGVLREGDPLPSVRNVAVELRLNPLTVLKGYQQLVDERLVEKRRGRGMYICAGAAAARRPDERGA